MSNNMSITENLEDMPLPDRNYTNEVIHGNNVSDKEHLIEDDLDGKENASKICEDHMTPDDERRTDLVQGEENSSLTHERTDLQETRVVNDDVSNTLLKDDSSELETSKNEDQRISVGDASVTKENCPAIQDVPRPTTSQTITNRPFSVTSVPGESLDFPTPDYDQFIRPSPSFVAETEIDQSDSNASQILKLATNRGDGAKSVTFADGLENTETERTPEVSMGEENASEKEELFSTAVSEEKIEEAVARKLESIALESGNNTTLCEQKGDCHPGSDILNKRANEHYDRGCQMSDTGDFVAAISAFDKAINLCPSEVVFYLMRGEIYLELTDFQSAIQNFKKVCVLRPTSDIHYSKLAFVYYLQGQSLFDQCLYTKALESFSRAAEMRPENIGYQTRSMACLAALERHGECLALVNKKLEDEQSNPDLYVMRARLHLLFRNTSLCYYDVKDALALDPEQQEAQRLLRELEKKAKDSRDLAVRLQLQGKLKEALQKITLAIEMNPSVAEFHLLSGAIHRRLHDFNSAIDDFLLALDKTDHDESDKVYMNAQRQLLLTYNDFAVDCFLGGHFDEAILLLNKAIKGEKREKGLYVNRGDCFFRLGELHFSLADYHQALELDPHDSLVRSRIASIHGEFGSIDYEEHSYQDAEARFTVAIQHNPTHSRYYLSRAKVRFMLENQPGARQDILISLHLEPTNDTIHSLLARLFPGKTVTEVMKGRAAKEAKITLDNAVVTASPVKLPDIAARLARNDLFRTLDKEGALPTAADVTRSPIALFMTESDFNKVLAKRKKMVATEVKCSFQDHKSLKKNGPKLKPQPPPRDFNFRGGHWKMADTQHPLGWRQFGLGIEMKDA